MKVFKTSEIAEMFKVSSATVQRWIREGKLKAKRIGKRGHFRIKEEDLMNL